MMTQHTAETRGGLQRTRELFGSKTSALLLAGIAIAGCTNNEQPYTAQTSTSPEQVVDDTAVEDKCPVPDTKAIRTVENIFAGKNALDVPLADESLTYFAAKQNIAAELDLTIHDYSEELLALKQDAYSLKSEIAFSKYLAKSNEYANKYGIEIVVGEKFIDFYDNQDSELSYKELNTLVTKQGLLAITDAIGELPVEFFEHIQLKKIVLHKINQSGNNGGIYGYMYPDKDGVIYIDPTYRSDDDYDADIIRKATLHEIFHQWDVQVCGAYDMDIDAGYDALNPKAIYGTYEHEPEKAGGPGAYLSAEDAYNTIDDLQIEKFDASQRNDFIAEDAIDAEIATIKNRIVVARYYGFASISEDKGTMGESLLDPYSYTVLLDKQSTIYHKKAAYLIARLRNDYPKLVDYFAAITYRS